MTAQAMVNDIIQNAIELDLDRKDIEGLTPLHQVMDLISTMHPQFEFQEGIITLLELGADPRICDTHGYKPVDYYTWCDGVRGALEYYELILDE